MKKRTKILILVVILLSLVNLITNNYSIARYVSNSFWNYYLGTKGFYFSSEQLGTDKAGRVEGDHISNARLQSLIKEKEIIEV